MVTGFHYLSTSDVMETGLYPHPGPSKQPLIVQSGKHDSLTIRLHAENIKQLYVRRSASVRAGWLGVVDMAQQ